jgi:glycosyltransferase involved in cell wall biosynthesis
VRSLLAAVRSRVRRARFRATPIHAWPILVGGKFAQTRLGRHLVSRPKTTAPHRLTGPASSARRGAAGRNVLFVSHCDFTGQSAYHVFSIATELERLGWSPAIAVPRSPRGVRDLGHPRFRVLSFREAQRGRVGFPDGQGPDLVHSFTPRQPVRSLTLDLVGRYGCPYVVHLEDNEMAVQEAVVTGAYDPAAVEAFLESAAGVSVIIDRLLELKPDGVPAVVIWPGYDQAIDAPTRPREAIRGDVGVEDGDLAILYPGNVHEVNADEVASLYDAVGSLRASGRNVILVKSGWNRVSATRLPKLGKGIRDLGWISRRRVLELLHAADVLVQPGAPGPFNDYRFPSKLPEFLASGQPVVLPRTNIGLHLEDGVDAMLLEHGDFSEIAKNVAVLTDDQELRERVGGRGRAFALRELQWSANVQRVIGLYDVVR